MKKNFKTPCGNEISPELFGALDSLALMLSNKVKFDKKGRIINK